MSQASDLLQVVMMALGHCRKRGNERKGWIVAALDRDGGCLTVELQELPPPVCGAVAVDLQDWSLYLGDVGCSSGHEGYRGKWRQLSVTLAEAFNDAVTGVQS